MPVPSAGTDPVTGEPIDLVTANLFLHHFPPDRLRELLAHAAGAAPLFAACEPRRARPLRESRRARCARW